jgi:hypothetical protein
VEEADAPDCPEQDLHMALKTRIDPSAGSLRAIEHPSVPVSLGIVCVLLVAVPLVSAALGLFDRVTHWGKLVHGLEGFGFAVLVGLLLLGWRDHEQIDLTDQLASVTTMFAGILFGVAWEVLEFILDWVRYSDLQKSNSDTMSDLLFNDVGAVLGALLATHLYCTLISRRQQQEIGAAGAFLVGGPSRVLDRHGFLIALVVVVLAALGVAAIWFSGRPAPGLGIP